MKKEFDQMLAGYHKLVGQIMPDTGAGAAESPAKMQWAMQEGYRPNYDPNSDAVVWTQEPKPAYQANHVMNLEGSMSPERMAEVYPAFALKAQHIDPVLQEIIAKALSGEITTQRAKELAYQLAIDTYKDAWSEGKGKGASKGAASLEQAMELASTKNRVAG